MTVLDELVAAAAARPLPPGEAPARPPSDFAARLRRPIGAPIRVIAEVKRASPSQGAIRPGASALAVARGYEANGAAAISVLTEPTRFGGHYDDLASVSAAVEVPTICKDFVVKEDQLRVAALLGARSVLLMVRVVNERLQGLLNAARALGLEPLVEVHDEWELELALGTDALVIGVNNRDLSTLQIDRARGEALLARVPRDRVRVAESGYGGPESVAHLDCDAVLVGTSLMRDPGWLAAVSAPVPGPPRVKVCGLTRREDAALALSLGADALGFVCTPGLSRSVAPSEIGSITQDIGAVDKAILVFRQPLIHDVIHAIHQSCISRIQLHQAEPGVVQAARRVAQVTVATEPGEPGTALRPSLWDSGSGGSGQAMDWEAVLGRGAPPFTWIAGGITPENVAELLKYRPWGIDLSSGIEASPGMKDAGKLRSLFEEVRR